MATIADQELENSAHLDDMHVGDIQGAWDDSPQRLSYCIDRLGI